jgi:RNA polymerase sigma-70 factor (ECF subfamily)
MSNLANGSAVSATAESELTDLALLEGLAAASRSAFVDLYGRHGRVVYAYAAANLTHREDAEEVSQDVFVTLWRKRGSLVVAGDSVLPWLLVTCKNLIRNRRKALVIQEQRRSAAPVDDTLPSAITGPEQVAEQAELLGYVDAAAADLPPADRLVFELCIREGRSYNDAAIAAGISPSAVRNRLSRLRTRLRSELHTLRGTS